MRREREAALAQSSSEQHGVFTAAQAERHGFDARARARRVGSGQWVQLFPRVYRLAGISATCESNLLAACFAGGAHARAALRSAAMVWGLPGASDDLVEIACPRWQRGRHPGLVVHEWCGVPAPGDVTIRHHIPVTSVDVTLLTLGSVVRESVVEQALDDAVNRSLTTMTSARATLERLARRGRDGCATLRAILDRRAPVTGTPESPSETRMLRMLAVHGLPVPALQHEVREGAVLVARVDAAYPDQRVALEYDSYAHHTGRHALIRDSARRNRLAALGWTVVTVTAEDLRNGGGAVAAAIRALLHRPPPEIASPTC